MNEEQPFRAIGNLRKAGKLAEAWELGTAEVQKAPQDMYVKGAFFWVCYDYLKQVQAAIKQRAIGNNGNYKPTQSELDRVNFLLDQIIWLDLPDGGFEYRSLLLIFQKNLEWFPKLVPLLVKHKTSLFEEKDKTPYPGEKGESPSLMLKFARKAASAWLRYPELGEINIDQLLQIFNEVRNQVSDTQHLVWLDYDEAKCLIKAGQMEKAREFVIPVLRKKQSEAWAWGALAVTYREQDPDAAITLYAQGLCQVHDEKFALQSLRGLAPLLAMRGFEKEASMCVVRAIKCYCDNGWSVKDNLQELTRRPWFDQDVDIQELGAFLKQRSHGALDYLYKSKEQFVAIVTNVHKSKKGFHVYRDREHQYSVPLALLARKKLPDPGSFMKIIVSAENESVIAAEPCAKEEMSDTGYCEGNLKVTGKGFGFVEDTFVPPGLVVDGVDGQLVRVLRVMDFDKSKNKNAWKAITLEVI